MANLAIKKERLLQILFFVRAYIIPKLFFGAETNTLKLFTRCHFENICSVGPEGKNSI